MLIQNLALYEDKYYIRVNDENDPLFYSFDYDVRSADINMQFQHFHPFYEFCIPLCPSATHFLEGKPYDLCAFDIIGISPNVLHRTQYPAGPPCKRLIIRFNLFPDAIGLPDKYRQLMSIFRQKVPIFRFDIENKEKAFRILNDIFMLSLQTDSMRNLKIHLRFIEFLMFLYSNQDKNMYTSESEIAPTAKKIYTITSYIHSHYTEDLSLDMLAEKFFISNCYLSHQFKDVTGFSVTDYIQMTRVRNVQALLMSTRNSITEIAESCGFSSFSQFNRVFQKHVGMSPSQYRKQNEFLPPYSTFST